MQRTFRSALWTFSSEREKLEKGYVQDTQEPISFVAIAQSLGDIIRVRGLARRTRFNPLPWRETQEKWRKLFLSYSGASTLIHASDTSCRVPVILEKHLRGRWARWKFVMLLFKRPIDSRYEAWRLCGILYVRMDERLMIKAEVEFCSHSMGDPLAFLIAKVYFALLLDAYPPHT